MAQPSFTTQHASCFMPCRRNRRGITDIVTMTSGRRHQSRLAVLKRRHRPCVMAIFILALVTGGYRASHYIGRAQASSSIGARILTSSSFLRRAITSRVTTSANGLFERRLVPLAMTASAITAIDAHQYSISDGHPAGLCSSVLVFDGDKPSIGSIVLISIEQHRRSSKCA